MELVRHRFPWCG